MTEIPEAVRLVWLAAALPLLGFLANGALSLFRPAARRAVTAIGVGTVAAAFAVSVLVAAGLAGSGAHEPVVLTYWSWIPAGDLVLNLAFQVDQLSVVMLLVVTGVGALIHVFSIGYMGEDPGYARYFAYLNLFIFFMLVLVLGSNFPVMFVGWEGVGLCSYLLIGFWFEDKANANAGKKAFIMNRIGDAGFLIAMFLIFRSLGTLEFTEVFRLAPVSFEVGGTLITLITLALFLGCTGKSAQIPLYTWLPDAMAGPTPVSALIHAATMVTAGVYLVARANVLFAMAPISSAVVAGIGALTALFAATIALKQWDIKKVIAYSTVSQLGYMFLGVGVGAYVSGIFHLVTHAFFKALMFLAAGNVIYALHQAYHATHRHEDAQDLRNMGGLHRYMPWTAALMWIGGLANIGLPPFSGFFSKDSILAAAFARGHDAPIFYVFWALGTVGAVFTALYITRLLIYTFHGPNRTGEAERQHLREAPPVMTGPLVILGLGSVFAGVLNLPHVLPAAGWLEHWLEPVTSLGAVFLPEFHLTAGTEWGLLALATAIAVAGIAAAWRLLKPEALVPARQAVPERGIERVLANKYYVDEIYDALIVRPLIWFSERVLWRTVDALLIDGVAVNGMARLTRLFGWIGSRLQTGQVGTYVVLFVLGTLVLLRVMAG
ncbi:NADH-quinone oxidoreductase subunit L [bacterium HR33]|nr:NADH-quinone oxidoreductase subunit L [bacterium HR33]